MNSFKNIGRELVENNWGPCADTDLKEATENADVNESIRNVLCYIASMIHNFNPIIEEVREIRENRWDEQFNKLFNRKYKHKTSDGLRKLVRNKTYHSYGFWRNDYIKGESIYKIDGIKEMVLVPPSKKSKYYQEYVDVFKVKG
jgi:hypothetical protein